MMITVIRSQVIMFCLINFLQLSQCSVFSDNSSCVRILIKKLNHGHSLLYYDPELASPVNESDSVQTDDTSTLNGNSQPPWYYFAALFAIINFILAIPCISRSECLSNVNYRLILLIFGWQCVALLLAAINIFSDLLNEWRTPTLMTAPMYLLLFIFTLFKSTNSGQSERRISTFYYLLASLCDVEGTTLLLTAYRFTSVTSVTLLDCWAVPMCMILAIIFLKQKYNRYHFMGVIVVLSGMGLLIYVDSTSKNSNDDNRGSNPVLGDILVLCGATSYAISNTAQEFIVKHNDGIWDYLRMIGLFGFIITLIQGLIFEHNQLLHSNVYDQTHLLYYLGYILSMSSYYIAVPIMIQRSSAVMFNLSILTTDFYVVVAGIFLFGVKLNALYVLAFILIILGLIGYNLVRRK